MAASIDITSDCLADLPMQIAIVCFIALDVILVQATLPYASHTSACTTEVPLTNTTTSTTTTTTTTTTEATETTTSTTTRNSALDHPARIGYNSRLSQS